MKSLSTTLAAGYLAIAVQSLTGLIFIPFLVSEEGVGLAGFATIATLQAAVGLVAIGFDGYRQYVARGIALAFKDGDRKVLPVILQFVLFFATVVVGLWLMVSPLIFKWIGIDAKNVTAAACLAAACVVIEQLSYVLECHQHATKRSWIPSSLGALDSVLRAILTIIFFKCFSATISQFFLAAFIGLSIKLAILLWLSPIEGRLPDGKWVDQMISQYNAFGQSMPLALNGIAPFVVFRGSVIIANAMLDGEQAGVIAIILLTLRAYINQGLFSVLRPMLIPRLTLVDFGGRTSGTSTRLTMYLDLFQVVTLFAGVLAVVSTPAWFTLWLGNSVKDYTGLAQITVAIYFLEIAYGVQYSCLIAHNNGRTLAMLTGLFALMAFVATGVGAYYYPNAASCIGPAMAYMLGYVAAVRLVFGEHFAFSLQRSDITTSIFAATLLAGISLATTIEAMSLLSPVIAGALFLGLSQVMGIKISIAGQVPAWGKGAADI